jgi:Cu/Ag efflux protein CusF
MRTVLFSGAVLLCVAFVVAGCQRAEDTVQSKQYEVKGKAVAVDKDQKTVTLDHEDIPGLMKGMQMQFKVENPQVLEDVSVGDEVHGQLEVRSGDYIITDVSKP